MADFTLSQIGGAPASPVQAQQGVQEASPLAGVSGLFSTVVKGISNNQAAAAQEAKAEAKQALSGVASSFSQNQLAVADAVDRGAMTSQEGRMRMRTNYSQAIADNPDFYDELKQVHSGIINTAGLGGVVKEGTSQEQAFLKVQDDAAKAGWVLPSMSAEESKQATLEFMTFNRAQQDIDAAQNQLALTRAQIGLKSDRVGLDTARVNNQSAHLTLASKQAQRKSETASAEIVNAYYPKFRRQAQSIQQRVENGELTREEGLAALDGNWASVQQTTAVVGAEAGGDYVNNLTAPMKFLYENQRKYISGEISKNTLENNNDIISAQQTASYLADPELRKIITTSRMFPNSDIARMAENRAAVNVMLGKNSKEDGPPANLADPDNAKDIEVYLGMARDNLQKINSGEEMLGGADAEKELGTNISQILKGVSAYSAAVESPEDLNSLAEFFASDPFGQYAVSNGTGFNKQDASSAKEIMMQQYEQEASRLIEEEWANAQTTVSALRESNVLGTSGSKEPTSSLIEPRWNGTGVSFVANNQSNTRVSAKARELNKRVAPVLNRLIRMGAHFDSTQNYKQVYEANYARLFGQSEGSDE